MENRTFLWGSKLVLSVRYRDQITKELHSGHQEMVRMKELNRIHGWFPNIDQQIKEELRNCKECTKMTKEFNQNIYTSVELTYPTI